MSKYIKVTEQERERIKKEFEEALMSGKWDGGKVSFQSNLGTVDRKAKVHFSDLAWRKMQGLISEFSSEVGWHGTAYRGEGDEYFIDDIMVYPQEVTSATVTTDQAEYEEWLMNHEDDVFNNIRFQGHSHVNMGVSPSSVDLALYKSILDQLSDDMFYIFMIWNKSNQKTVLIYDMEKNILFETADVEVVIDDETGYLDFMEDAKDKVVYKTTTTTGNLKAASSTASKKTNLPAQTTYNYGRYSWKEDWDDSWDDDYSYYGYGKRVFK